MTLRLVMWPVAVVAAWLVMIGSGYAIRRFDLADQLGGLQDWLPWLLYPGLVAYLAVRSNLTAIIAVGALLPASSLAAFLLSEGFESYTATAIPLALAAASGVLAGATVGVWVMRSGDRRGRIASGVLAAGLVGGVVTFAAGFPAVAGYTAWGWVSPEFAAAAVFVPLIASILLSLVAFAPGLLARR